MMIVAARRRRRESSGLIEPALGPGPAGEEHVGHRGRAASAPARGAAGRPTRRAAASCTTAIPPMVPICRSRMARSGGCCVAATVTAWPVRQTVKVVSGPSSAERTSSTTQSASVAIRYVRHGADVSQRPPARRPRRRVGRPGRPAGVRRRAAVEEEVGDLGQPVEVVDVGAQQRHRGHRARRPSSAVSGASTAALARRPPPAARPGSRSARPGRRTGWLGDRRGCRRRPGRSPGACGSR